jgi:competence protein ComEA
MKRFLLLLVMLLFSAFALAAVNINTATKEELDALPEIGPVKAQAIIDYRNANGPFKTPEDVMKVNGIKEGTFGKIKGMISVSGASTPVAAPAAKADAKTAPPPAMQPAPAAKSAAPATAATSATPAAPATKSAPATPSTTPAAGTGMPKAAAGGAAPSASSAKDAKTIKAEKATADKAAKAKAKADADAEAKAKKDAKAAEAQAKKDAKAAAAKAKKDAKASEDAPMKDAKKDKAAGKDAAKGDAAK